jgi:hypothetical protein
MGLYYKSQDVRPLIGSKVGTTITPAAVTSAYAGGLNKTFEVGGYSKADFAIQYTMGATETANSIELMIEQSPDGVNFYRIPNEDASLGVSTLTAREFTFVGTNAALASISIGLDIFYKYLKVSVKETGVVTNAGTVYVEATLSGA